jgi:hypothetical protein
MNDPLAYVIESVENMTIRLNKSLEKINTILKNENLPQRKFKNLRELLNEVENSIARI